MSVTLSSARALVFAVLVSLTPAWSLFAQEASPAKQFVPAPEFDFGTVSQGEVVKHDFVIENRGGVDLHIQRVVPACGCTASSASNPVIAPGAKGVVSVEFNTTGFSGTKRKTIRVHTDDPEQPSVVLAIRGEILPDVIVEPSRLLFGALGGNPGELTTEQEVTVRVREGVGISLGTIRNHSGRVVLDLLEDTPKFKRFKASLAADLPQGAVRDRVVVELKGGKRRSLNVPVVAKIRGDIEVKPSAVSFGVFDTSTTSLKRSVRVESHVERPFKITSVSSDNPALRTEVQSIREGKTYVIHVFVDPSKVARELRDTIEIQTDLENAEELKLNVYGIHPPASAG